MILMVMVSLLFVGWLYFFNGIVCLFSTALALLFFAPLLLALSPFIFTVWSLLPSSEAV